MCEHSRPKLIRLAWDWDLLVVTVLELPVRIPVDVTDGMVPSWSYGRVKR
jgi:hypothetical protein